MAGGSGSAGGRQAGRRLQHETAQRDDNSAVLVFVPFSLSLSLPSLRLRNSLTDRATSLAHASRRAFSLSRLRVLLLLAAAASNAAADAAAAAALTDSRPYFACIFHLLGRSVARNGGEGEDLHPDDGCCSFLRKERRGSLASISFFNSTRLLLKNTPSSPPIPSLHPSLSFPRYITSFSVNLLVINLLFFFCVHVSS